MDSWMEKEDNSSNQIFSSLVRPYRPPTYADFAENESSYFFECLDCGDRYFLESSLGIHLSRESISITYFCKHCDKSLHYKNKCKFLAHLREHPVKNREETTVMVRPLSIYWGELGHEKTGENVNVSEKISGDVNVFEKTSEDVTGMVNPSKSPTSPNIKKGCIAVTKCVDNHSLQFTKSSVKLVSTNAKSGEVKVIIRSQPHSPFNTVNKSVVCKECGLCVDDIRSHFLEDNKPLNSQLRCPSCDLILPAKCSLRAHVRMHLKKPPFVCPDCMKEFSLHELFMVHLKYFCFHLEKCPRFSCQACPGVFPTLTSLEVHLASKHVKPVYKCMACPRAFFEVKLLTEHKLQCHGETKVPTKLFEQCQLCPQKLLTKSNLFLHVHEHVTSKSSCFYCFKCHRCGFVAENKLDFSSHRLSCFDVQNNVNALALAKLAKDNLVSDLLNEGSSSPRAKSTLTVCLPNSSSTLTAVSSVSSDVSFPNRKIKNITVTSCATENKAGNKSFCSLSSSANQTIPLSQGNNYVNSFIPQRVYKACGWHPHKCLMCQNELVVGTLKAWENVPANYEGCHKWKLGNICDISSNTLKVISPGVMSKKSLKKNCLALNGPSNVSKLSKLSSFPTTYLCHICKHSLQIDHGIIKKHFRQQHPDVEIMSLKPLLHKLDFRKSNVPLQLLRFSVRPSKVLQVMVDRSKANEAQALAKKNIPQRRKKQIQNGIKSMGSVKPWFKCKECSFKTRNKKVHKRHISSHYNVRYECKKCNLEFVSESSYKIHLVMRHGMEEGKKIMNGDAKDDINKAGVKGSNDDTTTGKLKCKVCQKSFENSGDLQKHFRIHGMAFLMLNKDERVWRKV